MDDEEYDEEHYLDDDVIFWAPGWGQWTLFDNNSISGYDYMFLHQNRLKW